MPSERVDQALQSIADHGSEALTFLEGYDRQAFRDDRRTFHAVTRCLEIISEASRRLDDDVKRRHPQLPWRDIADAGNVYRHDYDSVAADFVFKTATQDVPRLLAAVREELARDATRA